MNGHDADAGIGFFGLPGFTMPESFRSGELDETEARLQFASNGRDSNIAQLQERVRELEQQMVEMREAVSQLGAQPAERVDNAERNRIRLFIDGRLYDPLGKLTVTRQMVADALVYFININYQFVFLLTFL